MTPSNSEPNQEQEIKTMPCPICKEEIMDGAKKCIYCREHLKDPKDFWGWTGLKGITVWGVVRVLIAPVLTIFVFAVGNMYTANQLNERLLIEDERLQESALHAYFDDMTVLILVHKLTESKWENPIRDIARSRTLAVVRRLDPARKGALLLFLHEAQLIDKDTVIIDLSDADLRNIDLFGTSLLNANLFDADLRGADLREANLLEASLWGADLRGADLSDAYLRFADLRGADLGDANLNGADLYSANLYSVNLRKADLREANLREADLSRAIYTDSTQWPPDFKPEEHGMVLTDD